MTWLTLVTAALLLFVSGPGVSGQDPPRDRGVTPVGEAEDLATGRLVLAVVGIDDYEHWQKLDNAVSDAVGVRKALEEKAGFTVPIPPLLDRQATKPAIMSLVEDQLRRELQPNDQLVFFFSGHGHTQLTKVGNEDVETGYLVPSEAPTGADERWTSYIRIDHLLDALDLLPARHVLVILDACHSGFALGKAVEKFRGGADEFRKELSGKVSRRAITSARRNQLASDTGPLPNHSLFTGLFVDGLTWGKMDNEPNGLITSSEIGLYLQQRVGQHTSSKQTPDFGAFGRDDRGELVISLNNQTFGALVARATSALYHGRNQSFAEILRELAARPSSRPEVHYLEYRLGILSRDVEGARKAVDALSSSALESGVIPLGQEDIWDLNQQISFWSPLLALQDSSAEVAIEVVLGTGGSVASQTLGEVAVFELPAEADYRLRIKNQAGEKRFVQLFIVSEAGRLKPVRLWEQLSTMFEEGIQPGATLDSIPLRKAGAFGIEELRLIVSKTPINDLVVPPDPKSRGIMSMQDKSREAILQSKCHTVRLVAKRDEPSVAGGPGQR